MTLIDVLNQRALTTNIRLGTMEKGLIERFPLGGLSLCVRVENSTGRAQCVKSQTLTNNGFKSARFIFSLKNVDLI